MLLLRIIGQIFAFDVAYLYLTHSFGGELHPKTYDYQIQPKKL